MSTFKCCKNKESTLYFCLVCKNAFHRSCWNRTNRQFTIIKDSFIICSQNCRLEATEHDPDTFDMLNAIINDLKVETTQKDAYIERLKRNSVSAVIDASRCEEEYLREIDEKANRIELLEKRLEEQQKIINKYNKEVASKAVQVQPTAKRSSC